MTDNICDHIKNTDGGVCEWCQAVHIDEQIQCSICTEPIDLTVAEDATQGLESIQTHLRERHN